MHHRISFLKSLYVYPYFQPSYGAGDGDDGDGGDGGGAGPRDL